MITTSSDTTAPSAVSLKFVSENDIRLEVNVANSVSKSSSTSNTITSVTTSDHKIRWDSRASLWSTDGHDRSNVGPSSRCSLIELQNSIKFSGTNNPVCGWISLTDDIVTGSCASIVVKRKGTWDRDS